jgi:hypothetical protein
MTQRNPYNLLIAATLVAALLLPGSESAAAADADWQAQYWNNRLLTGTPALVRTESAVSFDWGYGSPGAAIPKDNWSARWTKTATFTAGWYRFRTFTDDGVRLWVGGKLVIDQWFDMPGAANMADVYLTAGAHEVKMEYYERIGYARAYLTWSRFSGEPVYSGWKGEYYGNRTLSGDPAFIRDDPKIDFDWGWETVHPGVGLTDDNFSIRWTRTMTFEAGTWRFSAEFNDGLRVYVDGKKILDSWREQQTTKASGDVSISAGAHEVKVEYFEGRGQALVRLEWERIAGPPQPSPVPTYATWKGEYYNNRWLTGSPTLVRDDASIQFNWGAGSPAAGIPADGFSVRWTRALSFAAGTYRFYIRADDGVRLWVDGTLVIDQWNDQAATTHYGDIALSAGSHSVRLEYYENGGFAEVSLWWEIVSSPSGQWLAEYFNNTSLAGAPVRSEQAAWIQFDWGDGSPGAGVSADRFSARYTLTGVFAAGFYTFRVRSDDGVRLWVDDQLVLDRWVFRSATQDEIVRQLSGGTHQIRLEYFEEDGLAELKLSWEKREDAAASAWTAQYFTNAWLIGYPAVARTESALDFNWGTGSPASGIPADYFSARWIRTLTLPTARTLKFFLRTDDGARLWINNVLVLDKWYDQAATETHTVQISLAAGTYTIMLEYYEKTGLASAYLSWQ